VPKRTSRLLLSGLLVTLLALLTLGAARPAAADLGTDPDAPTVSLLSPGTGAVVLHPGAKQCWGLFQVTQSIHFQADVLPNIGTPLAKIAIWYDPDPSFSNPTKIYLERVRGVNAVNVAYTSPGAYVFCARYPLGQEVDGSAFDFIDVFLAAAWG